MLIGTAPIICSNDSHLGAALVSVEEALGFEMKMRQHTMILRGQTELTTDAAWQRKQALNRNQPVPPPYPHCLIQVFGPNVLSAALLNFKKQ